MKKTLLIVDWGNKFEKINRRILNSLFSDNINSRMYSVQYKGSKKNSRDEKYFWEYIQSDKNNENRIEWWLW